MWVMTSLDRVRRRLRHPEKEPPPLTEPEHLGDVVLALGRPELERFVTALAGTLDPHMPRPDSPVRLAGALATILDRIGGQGRPTVTRSPAGLYTPEYWHVRIDGADDAARSALQRLAEGRELD